MGHERTWWERMPMPSAMRRSRAIELDAEKAAKDVVELEGDRRREELEGEDKRVRFELEGEVRNVKRVVNVVVRSERPVVESGSNSATAAQTRGVMSVESSKTENGGMKIPMKGVSKAVSVKRELPPLPTDQGKPGCRSEKEKTSECETMRETRERERWKTHHSVGPDGSYNYR